MAKEYKTGVIITGDASGAVRAINLTDEQLKNLNATQGKSKSRAKDMADGWGSVAKQAAKMGAAVAAGAVAAAAGIGALIKKSIDSADSARDAAIATGITIESYTGLKHAAELSGVSNEKLTSSLSRFNKTISEAARGSKSQSQLFADMGISVNDASGKLKTADKLLLEVSDKFAGYEDGAAKAALAQEIFGKSGAALLPLLNEGAAGISGMTAEAERLGLVISKETGDAADEFNDSLTVLGGVVSGLGLKLAGEALPHLNEFTGYLQDPKTIAGISAIADGILSIASAAVKGAVEMANFSRWLGETIVAATTGIAADDLVRLEQEAEKIKGLLEGGLANAGRKIRFFGPGGIVEYWSEEELQAELRKIESKMASAQERMVDDAAARWRNLKLEEILIPADLLKRGGKAREVFTRATRGMEDAAKAAAKAENDFIKEVEIGAKELADQRIETEKLAAARRQAFADVNTDIEALEREIAALRKGEAAHQAVTRELAIQAEMRSLVTAGVDLNDAAMQRSIAIRYDLLQTLEAEKTAQQATADAAKAAAEESARVWEEAGNRVDEAFADAWKGAFDSFKDFGTRLKDAMLDLLGELAHMAITRPILVALGLTGGSTSALASGLGGGGGGSFDVTTLLTAGKTLWKGFSGLLSGQGLSGFSGLLGGGATAGLEVPAHMMTRAAAQQAASLSNFANTLGPILGGLAGAIQGWQTGNKANAVTGAAGGYLGAKGGAYVGSMILPGIGTAIGAALGAILGSKLGSSVFGGEFETTRQGVQLRFDDEGFDPAGYDRQTKKGGWFGSTKRRVVDTDLGAEMDELITSAYDSTVATVASLYEQIGVAVADGALEGVRIDNLLVNTSDQTQEEIEAQIAKWFTDLTNALVLSVDSSMDIDTLNVLATSLTGVNAVFEALHIQTLDLSLAGAESARALLELTGGLENLAAAADYYYQNFYSEAERVGHVADALAEQFATMNVAMPQTKEAFRALVESARDAGDAGQELFVQLLALAPAFNTVATAAEQAAAEMQAGFRTALADIGSTVLTQYNTTMADRATLEAELLGVNEKIATLTDDMAGSAREAERGLSAIPAVIDTISASVDTLAVSSSQLRGWSQNLLATVQQLMLSDLSPLTNQQRLVEAQNQFAQAQVMAENGDPTGLASAAQTYLKEAASYYASSGAYTSIFTDVTGYLSSLGVTLEGQADQAEKAEAKMQAAQQAQQAALESIRAVQQDADAAAREAAQLAQQQLTLQSLIAEQQRIEAALANNLAIDAEGILRGQLEGIVAVNNSLGSVAGLLATLPLDLAAALGAVIGITPDQYGVTGTLYDRQLADLSQYPQAANGGIFSGPTSGYPMALHGTEMVVPQTGGKFEVAVDQRELIAEIKSLRTEVAELRRQQSKEHAEDRQDMTKQTRELERSTSVVRRGSEVSVLG